jgi:hypothetical protein
MDTPRTLLEAVKHFAEPDNCLSNIWSLAAGRTASPARPAEARRSTFRPSRNGWRCKTKHANRASSRSRPGRFSRTRRSVWTSGCPTVWMIANCKNGVSSWEIHRASASRKRPRGSCSTASGWRCRTTDGGGKLGGDVEVDETYIGGKARNMHKSKRRVSVSCRSEFDDRQGCRHGPAGAARRRRQQDPHDRRRERRKGHLQSRRSRARRDWRDGPHGRASLLQGSVCGLRAQRDRPRRKVRGRAGPHERLRELLEPAEARR